MNVGTLVFIAGVVAVAVYVFGARALFEWVGIAISKTVRALADFLAVLAAW